MKLNKLMNTLILETAEMKLHQGSLQNRDSDFQPLFVSMKQQPKSAALLETWPRFGRLATNKHSEEGKSRRLPSGGSPACVDQKLIFMLIWW